MLQVESFKKQLEYQQPGKGGYVDGNGRMGRFLMNVMLAGGGYPWTVIPLETRNDYTAALEEARVRKNIEPFTRFLNELVQNV